MLSTTPSFNRYASSYEANAPVQAEAANALAAWIAPESRRGTAVELGAGTGLLTAALHPWNGTYLASDISANMVEQGRRNVPHVYWTKMDATTAYLPPDTDWIFSASMLQWIDNPRATLRHWHTQAPKANMALSIFVKGTLCELETLLPESVPLQWHSTEQWQAMIGACGWQITRAQTESAHTFYKNPCALLRTLRLFGGTSEKARTCPARLRSALERYPRAHNGEICATWQILRVLARG